MCFLKEMPDVGDDDSHEETSDDPNVSITDDAATQQLFQDSDDEVEDPSDESLVLTDATTDTPPCPQVTNIYLLSKMHRNFLRKIQQGTAYKWNIVKNI